jgi:hypothetical protein
MKTIKNQKTGEIKRLNDREAEKMVRQTYLGWNYVPKEIWKGEVRGERVKTQVKHDGPKKGKGSSK